MWFKVLLCVSAFPVVKKPFPVEKLDTHFLSLKVPVPFQIYVLITHFYCCSVRVQLCGAQYQTTNIHNLPSRGAHGEI